MILVTGSTLDYMYMFTASRDTNIWYSRGDVSIWVTGRPEKKRLSNFIQDNIRATTLSMVKISATERKQKWGEM